MRTDTNRQPGEHARLLDLDDESEKMKRLWDLSDQISSWLEERSGRDFSASQIGRGIGLDTPQTKEILEDLVGMRMVAPTGRGGSWRRYTAWT